VAVRAIRAIGARHARVGGLRSEREARVAGVLNALGRASHSGFTMGLRRAAVPPHRARIAHDGGPDTAFGCVSTPSRIVERRIAASAAVGCVRRWRSVAVDDRVVAAADRAPERDAEASADSAMIPRRTFMTPPRRCVLGVARRIFPS
jgi:hypothetical protein